MSYPATSPYYLCQVVNQKYLDVMIDRPIPGDPTDVYWEITATYNLRPDLLAYDLYQDPKLWWVFAQRNPNTLTDPLFSFKQGVFIFIPKYDVIKLSLGL